MFEHRIYGFVTVGTKGQVVIPADAREALGLNPGDHLFVVGSPQKGVLVLVPEDQADGFVEKINKKVQDFNSFKTRGPEESEEE